MNTEIVRIWGSPETFSEVQTPVDQSAEEKIGYLTLEYGLWKNLFLAQTPSGQDILEGEARKLAEALIKNESQIRFSLPEKIILPLSNSSTDDNQTILVPPFLRKQKVGGLVKRLTQKNLTIRLNQKLEELESNLNISAAIGAGLIRYATAIHLVHYMLLAGNRIAYLTAPGDEIPSVPMISKREAFGSFPISTTGISEVSIEGGTKNVGDHKEIYSPATQSFFIPEWISFDSQDRLIVNSFQEAEISLNSMQHFLRVLHVALSLAKYIIADPEYQEKRYGMLGQLVNQGRAMARYENKEVIQVIRQRVRTNKLNRGLNLKITYFDDQRLKLMNRGLEVIPAGRIIFHPAFVVLAARKERSKVTQDFHLNYSTRKHLQAELTDLERAFDTSESDIEK